MPKKPNKIEEAIGIFRKHGGMLRTSKAFEEGIHPEIFYKMVKTGITIKLSYGLYQLADTPPLSDPDHAVVAKKIPHSVICLISALAYYDLTTQVPHQIYIAISQKAKPPRIEYPPIRTFFFSGKAFSEGIETITIDKVPMKIYSKEKTLADCFKFRNKIGIETAIEALKLYLTKRSPDIKSLMYYASICRVTNVIKPYLESIL